MAIFLNRDESGGAYAPGSAAPAGIVRTGPEAGVTFEADVLFVSGSKVNIKLASGLVLRASVDGEIAFSEGDRVRFFVRESGGRRIVLVPMERLGDVYAATPEPRPAAARAPGMADSPAIMRAVISGGYPPSPRLYAAAGAILAAKPYAAAEIAVFLAANGIPATGENLEAAIRLSQPDYDVGQITARILEKRLITAKGPGTESGTAAQDGEKAGPALSAVLTPGGEAAGRRAFPAPGTHSAADAVYARVDDSCTGEKLKSAAAPLPGKLEKLGIPDGGAAHRGGEAAREIQALLDAEGLFRHMLYFAYAQIPVSMNGRRGTAQLFVRRRRRETGTGGGRGGIRVILTAETCRMGGIEVFIRIEDGAVFLKFTAENQAVCDCIRGHAAALCGMLSPLGYRISDIRYEVSAGKVTPINALAVFGQSEPGEGRKISIRV